MVVPTIKYVAFKGGGAKGLLDVGVIHELERLNLTRDIQEVAGSSVGAIFALLLATGLSAKGIEEIVFSTNFEKLINNHSAIINGWDLITKAGLHDGTALHKCIRDIIELVTGDPQITFFQWHELRATNPDLKELLIEACNISRGTNETFSAKNPRLRNQPIWKAIAASFAVPMYFQPIDFFLRDSDGSFSTEVFVDGGTQNNCPINVFNLPGGHPNPEALGIWLASGQEIHYLQDGTLPPIKKISTTLQTLYAEVNAFFEAETYHLYRNRAAKMVLCDHLNVDTLDFGISKPEKYNLMLSGKISVFRFMTEHYPELAAKYYSKEQLHRIGLTEEALTSYHGPKGAFPEHTYQSLLQTLHALPKPQDQELMAAFTQMGMAAKDPAQLVGQLAGNPPVLTLAKDALEQRSPPDSAAASATLASEPEATTANDSWIPTSLKFW